MGTVHRIDRLSAPPKRADGGPPPDFVVKLNLELLEDPPEPQSSSEIPRPLIFLLGFMLGWSLTTVLSWLP